MTTSLDAPTTVAQTDGLHHSLLDERLLHYRHTGDGHLVAATLPELFTALTRDGVRDFPALRPHQRHPWHAFLAQLAAIALHQAGQTEPWTEPDAWRSALLALTPAHPDGSAWCLVAPVDRPAFMQSPVPNWTEKEWDTQFPTPDSLDMLGTSKNHDLKAARMVRAGLEDWIFALVSLQTQSSSDSGSHKGISRMRGGWGRRPGVGIGNGSMGKRWTRDIEVLLSSRNEVAEKFTLSHENGISVVWIEPWDGAASLKFSSLDPLYIEICRRVRIFGEAARSVYAVRAKTPVPRINESQNGKTGDVWTPIDIDKEEGLTVQRAGIDYKLACDIIFPGKFVPSAATRILPRDEESGLFVLVQSIAFGPKNTNAGYHERRIPISKTMRVALRNKATDAFAQKAKDRIAAISEVRKVLWAALCILFDNGVHKDDVSKSTKRKANDFSDPFEHAEDARFFLDLIEEIESPTPDAVHAQWLLDLAERAEAILKAAFDAGPRSGMQRYRAQSAALGRFHGGLRSEKFGVQELSRLLRERSDARRSHEHDAQEVHHELG